MEMMKITKKEVIGVSEHIENNDQQNNEPYKCEISGTNFGTKSYLTSNI